MGQAKLKGSFEQRKDQAITKARALFPASVKCNNCGNDLTDIQSLNVTDMPGMRLAGAASCASCKYITWVLDGTPEALDQMQHFLQQEHGDEVKSGMAMRTSSAKVDKH